jgi:hypothetical protein
MHTGVEKLIKIFCEKWRFSQKNEQGYDQTLQKLAIGR